MLHPNPVTQAVPTVKPGTVVHNKQGQPIGTVVTLPNGKQTIKPITVPGATPQSKPTIQAPVGTTLHNKNGAPIGTVIKLPNGQKGIQPLAVPTPGKPGTVNGVKQVTPTVNNAQAKQQQQLNLAKKHLKTTVSAANAKQQKQNNAKANAQKIVAKNQAATNQLNQAQALQQKHLNAAQQHLQAAQNAAKAKQNAKTTKQLVQAQNKQKNSLIQAQKHLQAAAKANKQQNAATNKLNNAIAQGTPQAIPTPVTPPKITVKPVSVPQVAPVHHQGATVSHSATWTKPTVTGKHEPKEIKRDVHDEIIEPGIRNKEVETYRTNDAKEKLYNDTIKQDDKNVTLSPKRMK